jgi:hypothetical protein
MAASFKNRALVFLYGAPNIAGCALALGGLGLFFFGVIQDWWLPICAGLYAGGYLVAPSSKGFDHGALEQGASVSLPESVAALIEKSRSKLPSEATALLEGIKAVVEGLAPKLADGSLPMEQSIVMANAVTRDLPTTVGNYLKLPPAFANFHAVDGGKTCKALLIDQLQLLDGHLRGMAESAYRQDAQALRVNGMVLQEKFRPVSFLD